jgi:gliding motility-associated protein GldC
MKKKINLTICLDENNIPEHIYYVSNELELETKALILSIWDDASKEIIKIDTWTKYMKLKDMQLFFYNILLCLSETYIKASLDYKTGKEIQKFAFKFAKNTHII